jgi:hypothetical protein
MPTTYTEFYFYILEHSRSGRYPTKEFLEAIYEGSKSKDEVISSLCYFTIENVNDYLFPKDV